MNYLKISFNEQVQRKRLCYQLNIKALHDFILCFGRPGPGDVVDEALKKCDTGEGEYITIMFSKSVFFYKEHSLYNYKTPPV